MPKRAPKILDLDDPEPVQLGLFINPAVRSDGIRLFPPILRDEEGFKDVLAEAAREGRTGLDLEFSGTKPTILGIASRSRAASIRWDDRMAQKVIEESRILSGHAVTDADKPVLDSRFGIETPLTKWSDTMIRHYLCSSELAAEPGKTEDDDDAQAMGWMNIWAMSTLYTELPAWKNCRKSACFGPCPTHDVFGYNAIDAWAGLECDYKLIDEMAKRHIPERLYRELQDLTVYCGKMTAQGIKIDRAAVGRLETDIQRKKAELFPYETGKKKIYGEYKGEEFIAGAFNPGSPDQVLEYFDKHGIALVGKGGKAKADKETIRKALVKQLKITGVEFEEDRATGLLSIVDDTENLPEVVENLYNLDQWRNAGKGLTSWFNDKYIDKRDFTHPRFIVTGTSLGRLSSSGPNFQNIPRVGFGVRVRQAIVPREAGMAIIKADKRQLELRIMLWYAGGDATLKDDPFNVLVEASNGMLKPAAARKGQKERDLAKSAYHANSYMEGLKVVSDADLRTDRIQKEIKAGALLVFDGRDGREKWQYAHGHVAFTGGNLAERIFGDRTLESRKKALHLQSLINNKYPCLREFHKSLSRQIEKYGYFQSVTGRYLTFYGDAEDNLKLCAAMCGQGGGADEVQEGMRRFQELNRVALIQVHDELVFEVPGDWTDDQYRKYMEPFCEPSRHYNGLVFPIEISVGPTWHKKDMRTL